VGKFEKVPAQRRVMPARPEMGREKGGIQALDRAFLILDVLAEMGGEAKLSEIATLAKLNISTCHHLISTLYNWGYVSRGIGSKSYTLGTRILYLGAACLRQIDLPRRAQRFIDRLSDQTHEAVQLAVLQDTNLMTIVRREARHAVRVDAGTGNKFNASHATATGKAILAWLPRQEAERVLAASGMVAFTPKTITSSDILFEELRQVRRTGYSVDREEFQPGVICIGGAIRDHQGAVVGALSVSSPIFRVTSQRVDEICSYVIAAAHELSDELGAPTIVPSQRDKATVNL
jgi:IclR family transcriptional regulator, acetate operon repressor